MHILFITSSRLSEAVIATGILEKLRHTYPKARITVACGASCAGLFSRLPKLEDVLIVGKGNSRDFHQFRLWARLIGRFWDIAVDTRGSTVTRYLFAGQRKIIRVRKHLSYFQQLSSAMDYPVPALPVVWTAAADQEEAERRLPDGGSYLGLGPTASWTRKAWPLDRFIELSHALCKVLPGCKPVLFSGPSDAERLTAGALQSSLPNAVTMPTLPEPLLAACMSRLQLFIGNDTGLMHLAAASGAPTLGLFGKTSAVEWAPAGPRAAAVAAPGPDGDTPMEDLSVEAVLDAAMSLLRGK